MGSTLTCEACYAMFDASSFTPNSAPLCPACRGVNAPSRRRARTVPSEIARQVRLAQIGMALRDREQQVLAGYRKVAA